MNCQGVIMYEIGKIYQGKVTAITKFGAFVEFENKEFSENGAVNGSSTGAENISANVSANISENMAEKSLKKIIQKTPKNQTGMVHISEIADCFVGDINDFLEVSDTVQAKFVSQTPDGKLSFSIKQVMKLTPKNTSKDFRPYDKNSNRNDNNKPFTPTPENFSSNPPVEYTPLKSADNSFEPFEIMMKNFKRSSEERISAYKRSSDFSKKRGK
jgi:S1 RNA binding domain protein